MTEQKPEELRFLEDHIGKAWRLGKEDKGINVTTEAKDALDFLRRWGYVKLAEDQTLPSLLDVEYDSIENIRSAEQDMRVLLEQGWRKVISIQEQRRLSEMEAKDTVLKANECLEMNYDWDVSGGYKEEAVNNLLLEQAEITWEAREPEIAEAFKAGERESDRKWRRTLEDEIIFASEVGEWLKKKVFDINNPAPCLTEQEKLGDLIYKTLKENEIAKPMGNRAYVTDILSEAIIRAGYVKQPESMEITELAEVLYNFMKAGIQDYNSIKANIQSFLLANHYVKLAT